MDMQRRQALKSGGGVTLLALLAAAGWLKPGDAAAAETWNKAAFETHSLDDTMKALGGGAPAQSKDITFFSTPDIAENGAVVPMAVASALPNLKHLLVLVEKNPSSLVAKFDVSDAVEPSFSTRAKMGQTSDVYAVAITKDNKAFFTKKEVKVTLGGCGG
jgi:sulfur-oxidizing protein SoxY